VERRRWSNGEARVEEQVEGRRALYQEGKALVRKGQRLVDCRGSDWTLGPLGVDWG
jgi:hypothetical protein